MNIAFEPFQEKHFPLLLTWLQEPHVKEFWSEPEDENEVKEVYLKKMHQRGLHPQIFFIEGRPVGYIQSYQACEMGGGWWPQEGPGVYGIDLFIGEPSLIGKGLGSKIIKKFIDELTRNFDVKEIIIDPDPTNLRAIRSYEKVGFKAAGVIQTPTGQSMLMRLCIRE